MSESTLTAAQLRAAKILIEVATPMQMPIPIHDEGGPGSAGADKGGRRSSRVARGRRQRIEELLAACATDVAMLEKGAAREVATSDKLARLLCARAAGTHEEEDLIFDEDAVDEKRRLEQQLLRGEGGDVSGSDGESSLPSPEGYGPRSLFGAVPSSCPNGMVRPLSADPPSVGGNLLPLDAICTGIDWSAEPSGHHSSLMGRGRSGSAPNLHHSSPLADDCLDGAAHAAEQMLGASSATPEEAGELKRASISRETATTTSASDMPSWDAPDTAEHADAQSTGSGSGSDGPMGIAMRTNDTVWHISRSRGEDHAELLDGSALAAEGAGVLQQQQQQHDSNFSRAMPGSLSSTAPVGLATQCRVVSTQAKHKSLQDDVAVMAVQILEVMAQDNTVMECNLRDYDDALCVAMREALHLRAEVAEMEKVQGHVSLLQDILSGEIKVHDQLREEHHQLSVQNHELLTAMYEAASSDEDHENAVLIEGLIMENTMLRSSLFTPNSVVIGADFRQQQLSPTVQHLVAQPSLM